MSQQQMISDMKVMNFQNKRLIGILVTAAGLLLIPFVAMLLKVDGVKWDGRDFIVMGVLLLGTGLMCELVLRVVTKTPYRLAICAAILGAFLLVWAELAVGIIGTRFAGS